MGFMDKAKKLAEQAQQKLDEAQTELQPGRLGTGAAGAGASSTTSTGVRSRRARPADVEGAAGPRRRRPGRAGSRRPASAAAPTVADRPGAGRRARPASPRERRRTNAIPDPFKPLQQ